VNSRILVLMTSSFVLSVLGAGLAAGEATTTETGAEQALQEIVVTATKRTEDIQNIGLSITAFSAAQIEDKGVEQFFDYGTSVPNLSFSTGAGDGSLAARGIYLRGVQGANTTGFYIDDTPVLETLDPHIVDVQRIEVLRGPQGTLYGAESMGGTVRIITAQPDPTAFSAQLHSSGSYTDHGSWNELVEGDVNLPLSSTLAFRASGFYQSDSGWFDKWIGPESAPPEQVLQDVGSMTYYGGQVALKFEPVQGLSITPRLMFQETDQVGVPYATYYPSNLVQREAFDIAEGGTDRWWLGSLTINYAVPFGSFVSSSAVFDRRTNEIEDDSDDLSYSLGLNTTVPGPITRDWGWHRIAEELRFASSFFGPVQFILGGFYSYTTRPRDYEWTSPDLTAATGWPTDLALSFKDQREAGEYAVFGNVSYDILSNLKATAGVRWYRDTATFNQYTNGLFFGGASTYNVPGFDEKGYTPKYLLEYKLTPDILAYVSAAKGFRPGGDNIELPPGPAPFGCDTDLHNLGVTAAQIATFRSDSLWDYEGGFKTSWLDHRYTVNATGFVIEWDNIQQLVALPLCGYGYTGNSGKAQSAGAELEVSGRPLPELTVGLGLGYDDAHITQQGIGSPQPVGSPVTQVPDWTVSANLEYARHITADWSGFGRIDYSYVGPSYSANNATVNPQTGLAVLFRRAGYDIVNLRGGVRGERYELAAFVKNLTDVRANLADAILIGATVPGQPRIEINQPRTIGAEIRFRFE